MPPLGRNGFTVQESVNVGAYSDWYYEELDINDSSVDFTDDTCDTNHTSGISDGETDKKSHISHDINANIVTGLHVTGAGIPDNSYIITKNSNTVFRINADVTATNTDTELRFRGGAASDNSTYVTSANPAKKIVLYEVPGSAASYLQSIDTLTLTINSNTSSEKKIDIDAGDLPFIISGVLITSLSVSCDQANLTDKIAMLSFH